MVLFSIVSLARRLQLGLLKLVNNLRVFRLARKAASRSRPSADRSPVIFFNASTRLGGVSQNGAFAFLSSIAIQLKGVPVVHFGCRAGMTRCPLGTNPDDHTQPPPCRTCISQAEYLFSNAPVHWFRFQSDSGLEKALENRSFEELVVFEYASPLGTIPLGQLTLPSLRWSLRRHHLPDNEPTRFLFREFIRSAYHIAAEFQTLLDQTDPQAVVVFNGIMFPEGTARWVAKQRGIRVITHEVAHQPFTAFFSDGEATAYPVDIPPDFELSESQNARLDAYLEKRFQGDFTMAGVEFWPEMRGLDESFLGYAQDFKQVVAVFTNVIFDTSQVHANTVFDHMFAWLDQVLEIARAQPESLFVIRAHPDELRPNSRKKSRETVGAWIDSNAVQDLPNVVYIDPLEFISSYALIQRAKFVMVYNSTIGLEAALMGKPVLCAGQARYTQVRCVFFPHSPHAHCQKANELLAAETIGIPPEFIHNARRFLYYQLFRTPLPFGDYLGPHPTRGYVQVKKFPLHKLHPRQSITTRVISEGILENKEFLVPEEEQSERR